MPPRQPGSALGDESDPAHAGGLTRGHAPGGSSVILVMQRSAIAAIVRVGVLPGLVGLTEPFEVTQVGRDAGGLRRRS
jgi:hypothetical protein